MKVHAAVARTHINGKRCSGRVIDTLVCRVNAERRGPSPIRYYVDRSDRRNPKKIDSVFNLPPAARHKAVPFCLADSYNQEMALRSKQFFDVFRRGRVVRHKLKNGNEIDMALCQFSFFCWALRNCVFDYIVDNYEDVQIARKGNKKRKKEEGKEEEKKKQKEMCAVRYFSHLPALGR